MELPYPLKWLWTNGVTDNLLVQYLYLAVLAGLAIVSENGGSSPTLHAWSWFLFAGLALSLTPSGLTVGTAFRNRDLFSLWKTSKADKVSKTPLMSKGGKDKDAAATDDGRAALPAVRNDVTRALRACAFYHSTFAYAMLLAHAWAIYLYSNQETLDNIDDTYPSVGTPPLALLNKLVVLAGVRSFFVIQSALGLASRSATFLYEKNE